MGKTKNTNQEDIRKSVKTTKKRGKGNIKELIRLLVIFIFAIVVILGISKILKNKKIVAKEIIDYNYFLSSINGKFGVIDKNGNKIIDNKFEYLQIPNPEEDIFICMSDDNGKYITRVLNSKNKEILTKYKNIQAIPNNNTSIKNSYQTQILTYKEKEKIGIIDIKGNKITEAIYDNIETLEYKDEILKVKIGDKYGLINLSGDTIVDVKYNMIMTDGYYNQESKYDKAGYIVNVRTDKGFRYGYLNYKGKEVLDTIYTNIKRITEKKEDNEVYLVTYKNGKAGILKNGQTLFENEYEDIEYDAENNIIVVQKNAKQGLFDFQKNIILPIQYENIVFAGKYINAEKDGQFLVFDLAGILQNKESNKSLQSIENGKYNITINRDNKYGIIDSSNNNIVENKYSYIEYAFDDYFIVILDGKTGVIDSNDNIKIPIENDIIQNIRGTKIIQILNTENKITEIYNQNLEKVSEYVDARIYIRDDYVEIQSNDNIEYYDINGNKKDVKEIFNNKILAKAKDGKWGFVDKQGKILVEFKYDMATNFNKYGYAAIKKDGKWGCIDKNGKIIKEPTYEIEDYSPNFIGEYYEVRNVYEIPYFTNE